MTITNSHLRTTGPTRSDNLMAIGRNMTYTGLYLGYVKSTKDIQKNGRIQVWIPEKGTAPEDPDGWVTASYCSPFAGSTNYKTAAQNDFQSFDKTITSYGMWMIPPDINNEVLVMFITGREDRPVWIGCLYNEYANNMIPGMASSSNNYQYKGKNIPVAEYNKWDKRVTQESAATNQTTKPFQKTKFKGLSNQGLILDRARGITTTSARRESPSSVFGILTPGPAVNPDENNPENIRRKGGSAFIMDDGTGTEYIQLTTKTGAQIRLDETNGFVYLINRDGTAWVQMDQKGNVDIFGATNVSMRAQRDFNIRADRNVNIEAGQNVFIKAAMDTQESTTTFTYDVNNIPRLETIPYWKYVGEGQGQGGNIVMQALNDWHSTTKSNAYITVKENNLNLAVGNAVAMTTERGGVDIASKMGVKITTEAALDIAAKSDIRIGTNGKISVVGDGNISFCTENNISLNATGEIIMTSGDKTSMDATSVEIGTGVVMDSLEVQSIKAVSTESNSMSSATIVQDDSPIGGAYSGGAITPTTSDPIPTDPVQSAQSARAAEIKAMVEKINILATWKDPIQYPDWQPYRPYNIGFIVKNNSKLYIAMRNLPPSEFFDLNDWDPFQPEDKFKRESESMQTTATRLPTYEPCPEHENFSFASISGYTPKSTNQDKTYVGSGGAGNSNAQQPPMSDTPGANNRSVPAESPSDNVVTKDLNTDALRCQLTVHEGYKNVCYRDSVGLLTGGIGHLLREPNETAMYPLGAPISNEQINQWYEQDSVSAIKGIQELLGIDVWGELSDIRKRACADLCYNLGKAGLGKFKTFLSCMKNQDYASAGNALRDSKWFTQVGRRGTNIITMIVQNVDPLKCDKKSK
jgi:lysozyme